ncbi:hypothetical protein D3C76_624740 [compost metagenome]
MAVGCDPRDDHHDDHRDPEDLQEQRGDADDGPHQQVQHITEGAIGDHQHEGHQQRLNDHRQQQGRGVQAADAGDDAADRLEQRLGGAHRELAQRVVEVGLDQLQYEAQQDDHQVQADQGLHHENRGA